jgi:hypothetical protein
MVRVVIPPRPAIVRMARRLCVLFAAGLLYLGGVATGLGLIGYRLGVAIDHLQGWGGRLAVLEQQYQRDHVSTLRTNKAQAAVIAQRAEERRTP